MANMPTYQGVVNSQPITNQEVSSVTFKHPERVGNAITINRSLSNPQLLSGSRAMASSSSLRQLAPAHIINYPPQPQLINQNGLNSSRAIGVQGKPFGSQPNPPVNFNQAQQLTNTMNSSGQKVSPMESSTKRQVSSVINNENKFAIVKQS
jgi:hypothetical protein